MGKLLEMLQGRKTYLLVLVAVVMVLAGVTDPEAVGLDFEIDGSRMFQSILLAMVATIKAAFNRQANGGS